MLRSSVAICCQLLLIVILTEATKSNDVESLTPSPTKSPDELTGQSKNSHLLVAVQRYLWGYVAFAIIIVGLLGNGLSIAVLRSPRMASSTSDYLAALAAADIVILLLFAACMGLPQLSTDYRRLIDTKNSIFIAILYPVSLFAQMFGTYTTACFTVERCLSVMLPLRFGGPLGSNRARARRALLGVTVFCLVYNAPRALEFVPLPSMSVNSSDVWSNSTENEKQQRTLRSSLWYNRIYGGVLYTLFMYALPLAVITTANALLIRAIRAANSINNSRAADATEESTGADHGLQQHRPWHQECHHYGLLSSLEQKKRLKRETSISLMLVTIVMVFIFCQTFCFVDNLVAVIHDHQQPGLAAQLLYIVAQFMVVVNSSVNFLLFCFFGEKFRRELNRILSGLRGAGRGGGGGSGGNGCQVGGLQRNWTGPAATTANGADRRCGSRRRRYADAASMQPQQATRNLNFLEAAACSSNAMAGTSYCVVSRGVGEGDCIAMSTLRSPNGLLLVPCASTSTNTSTVSVSAGTSGQ